MKKFILPSLLILLVLTGCAKATPVVTESPAPSLPGVIESPASSLPVADVTSLVFGDGASNLGRYVQTGTSSWQEEDISAPGQATFVYEETGRDATSIYLFDSSRNVSIELNLQQGAVNFDDGTTVIAPLYFISSYDTAVVIPVADVTSLVFSDGASDLGRYVQTGTSSWQEEDISAPGQATFVYEETGRDATSIYLFDSSRNVFVELNLQQGAVNFDDGTTVIAPLYFISSYDTDPIP